MTTQSEARTIRFSLQSLVVFYILAAIVLFLIVCVFSTFFVRHIAWVEEPWLKGKYELYHDSCDGYDIWIAFHGKTANALGAQAPAGATQIKVFHPNYNDVVVYFQAGTWKAKRDSSPGFEGHYK